MPQIAPSVDDAIAAIPDGAMIVVPRESSGVPMEATRALIRHGVKRLHLVALPTSTLQADMLIGAGCVETLETSAVSLGEFGPAPRFTAAILGQTIKMKDATCPALYASMQAAEKGVPFIPLRGLIGSDILAHRPDWRVIDNPFANNDPIVLLPAIKPDFALFHAGMADRFGNVFIGRDRELLTMAHAATRTIDRTISTPVARPPASALSCHSMCTLLRYELLLSINAMLFYPCPCIQARVLSSNTTRELLGGSPFPRIVRTPKARASLEKCACTCLFPKSCPAYGAMISTIHQKLRGFPTTEYSISDIDLFQQHYYT